MNEYVYEFSVDYNTTDVGEIADIHRYLMKKHNIKWCLNLLRNLFLCYYVLVDH